MNTQRVICFGCANLFESQDDTHIVCPACGYEEEKEYYEDLVSFAAEAFRYGYDYRVEYEKQLSTEGSITTHYCLGWPENIFIFITLTVLSTIIGDITRATLKKIREKLLVQKSKWDSNFTDQVELLLKDEEELEKFSKYLREYVTGNTSISVELRGIISKEKVIDQFCEAATPAVIGLLKRKGDSSITQEEIEKILTDRFKSIASKEKRFFDLSKIDNFWHRME